MRRVQPARRKGLGVLERIDLGVTLAEEIYEARLRALQIRLLDLQRATRDARVPVVVVYEGMDASGKGGNIRRLTQWLDQLGYAVHEIGPPTDEELAHHYLWRFWTRMPARGQMALFDRSWHGRVLVERVDKLTPPDVWRRAYSEIKEFERLLVDDGTILVKILLHIGKDEQLRRFQQREADPLKRWKLTPADWHNRDRWNEYMAAFEQMLEQTSTPHAPWLVIPAEDKRHARVAALEALIGRLEDALSRPANSSNDRAATPS